MQISWYDKRVLTAIMPGLFILTLATIVIDGLIRMNQGNAQEFEKHEEYEIIDSAFQSTKLMPGVNPEKELRRIFNIQTNDSGGDKLWNKYYDESYLRCGQEYYYYQDECTLFYPVIQPKTISPNSR